MIVLAIGIAWYACILLLQFAAHRVGRPVRTAPRDWQDSYETGRMDDRLRHFDQVRREELSQLRRAGA